ncbi:hypothetical protein ACQQ4G_003151 [Listeria monocytogenes]
MKKVLFWVASFTWGLPLTLFGSLVAIILLIAGYKPKRFHWFIYFEVGEDWGGFEGGMFIITCKNPHKTLLQHEAGHGIQNIMFGFLMPFIVSIPSAIRYWYRTISYDNKGLKPKTDYYDIWFEKQANELGQKYFK